MFTWVDRQNVDTEVEAAAAVGIAEVPAGIAEDRIQDQGRGHDQDLLTIVKIESLFRLKLIQTTTFDASQRRPGRKLVSL